LNLRAIAFSEIAGWREDSHEAALAAFLVSARSIADAPPKTRALGIDGVMLQRAALSGLELKSGRSSSACAFFERHFAPHRIDADGFITGYYEPEVAASLMPGGDFTVPLYSRPHDLVEVRPGDAPAGWDCDMRLGRLSEQGIVPYFDRHAIEDGALAGRGLEIAWLADPVDAFFIHVQGSARLRLTDATTLRIAFDGKSGHPYTSIGRLAVERGLLAREAADKDGLEDWLKGHRREGRALMCENRSFIFFRATGQNDTDGPIGAAGVPLVPGRSLAVDRTLHTFHTPVWVDVPALADGDRPGRPFRRLMVAHDTGSAIVGPARGDIFVGSGTAAGSAAGRIRHAATMITLVPKDVFGAA
jgi:membrane-bound lytic murein transglycosylase A